MADESKKVIKQKKYRTATAVKEITGMAGALPVNTRLVVRNIDSKAEECTVERLDGNCTIVGVPLDYLRLDSYVEMLESENGETYAHNYNLRCPNKHEVRLVGHGQGALDHVRFGVTKDIVAGGDTFEEAAGKAWQEKYG